MARTQAGADLTVQHRQAQLQIRALALRDYQRIFPIWRGDFDSFLALVEASLPLVRVHHQTSTAIAAAYYEAFRKVERVGGVATPRPGPEVDPGAVRAGLIATGREQVDRSVVAGFSPQAALQNAFVTTSGSITRQVLMGGRGTLVLSTGADKQAEAWARVTGGSPCAFCAMLASQGPVYHGADTAEFEAHDHCSCEAEPSYAGSEWPGRAREFQGIYQQAKADALKSGDLQRGTSNDLLNAFRRAYEA